MVINSLLWIMHLLQEIVTPAQVLAFLKEMPQIWMINHSLVSVVSRVLRTLHGSSDDIGWLQCAPGMSPVEDGSTRFLEPLHSIRIGISAESLWWNANSI